MRDDLRTVREIVLRALRPYRCDVYLFGSRARGTAGRASDIDVAVRTAARMAALIGGFLTADPSLFAAAHGDELHEAPRSRLVPGTADLLGRARSAGALHAAWSGSGPSVLAIVTAEAEGRVVAALSGGDTRVLSLDVAASGLEFSA
jgi:homoserine kinase